MEHEHREANSKRITDKDLKTNNTISFAFLGDLMIGGEFIPYAKKQGKDFLSPFTTIEPFLSDVDILFVNLEGPIFEGPNKRPDVTSIHSNHPSIIKYFDRKGRICVLNLGNNHIMDYGEEGLNHTIKILKNNRIYWVGAGINIAEAEKHLIIELKGLRIAFLAYTSDERNVGAIIAGPGKSGCASFSEIDKIINKIEKLKKDVDIICVSMHWGYEYFLYPSYEQVKIAHSLADAGATYIIGHHPHVIQGIETYKRSLIIYSLGNFFFPPTRTVNGRIEPLRKKSREFMLVKSKIEGSKNPSVKIVGGVMEKNYTLKPFNNYAQIRFTGNVEKLAKPITFQKYDAFWMRYKIINEKELLKESIKDAFRKIFMMSIKELFRTITKNDIKRNLNRICKLFFKKDLFNQIS